VLQVENLRFAWPGQPPLFDRLTITLGPGLHAVCGDDGCGKSTLLALLAGEHASHTGSVVVDGVSLAEDRAAYQGRVFWIDPATDAFDAVSARAFLATQPERHPGFEPAIARELAEALGLSPHLDKPLYMLSAGSKRKVWLSAAMASGAPLTLIDQAFAALDAPSTRLLRELLTEAGEHPGRAFLLADHEAAQGLPWGQVINL
jgi:ABC-type multidrug transport system ATPase subunit